MLPEGEKNDSGVVSTVVDFYERIMESNTSANILIIILIILAALPMLGIGIVATRGAAPADLADSGN